MIDESKAELLASSPEEYEIANKFLTEFAEKLCHYPPIADISTDESIEIYLKKIAIVVKKLLPLKHQGLGTSNVADQCLILSFVTKDQELPRTPEDVHVAHDCKLNAAVTGYLLEVLAKKLHLPIQPELVLRRGSTHAYVGVRVGTTDSTKVYVLHYDTDSVNTFEDIFAIDSEKYEKMIAHKEILSESDLQQGLKEYDRRFHMARAMKPSRE